MPREMAKDQAQIIPLWTHYKISGSLGKALMLGKLEEKRREQPAAMRLYTVTVAIITLLRAGLEVSRSQK